MPSCLTSLQVKIFVLSFPHPFSDQNTNFFFFFLSLFLHFLWVKFILPTQGGGRDSLIMPEKTPLKIIDNLHQKNRKENTSYF
jgi:hypothetical protein